LTTGTACVVGIVADGASGEFTGVGVAASVSSAAGGTATVAFFAGFDDTVAAFAGCDEGYVFVGGETAGGDLFCCEAGTDVPY